MKGKFHPSPESLIVILLFLFLASIGAIYFFLTTNSIPHDPEGKIKVEIIKTLLEFSILTIIGGGVTALFKVFDRIQEEMKVRVQKKLDFIKRFGKLYRAVKKSRRLLRSQGFTLKEGESPKVFSPTQVDFYSNQMSLLIDIQLELEGYKIAWDNSLFFGRNERIVDYLDRMEKYLSNIISHFEKPNQDTSEKRLFDFNDYKFLWEFTDESKNTSLKNDIDAKYIILNSDTEEVYYCFKQLFSLSYAEGLKELH